MDILSTLECYFKIYKSIGKSSENIRKKGLTYCMKKRLKEYVERGFATTREEHDNCLQIFQGCEHKEAECLEALKRRLRFMSPVCLFRFNPTGIENFTGLQHRGRIFLSKKFTDFFLEGGAYYLGTC